MGRFALRPWFRRRLDSEPDRWVLALAAASGLSVPIANFSDESLRQHAVAMVAFLAVSPLLGVAAMYANARLLYWAGKPLGGDASYRELRAAHAWSCLPLIVVAPVRIPTIVSHLLEAKTGAALALADLSAATSDATSLLCTLAGMVEAYFVISFVGEAQGFSRLRAAVNGLLAPLLGLVLVGAGVALGWYVSVGYRG